MAQPQYQDNTGWDPNGQWGLNPETNQYQQQPAASPPYVDLSQQQPPAPAQDWSAVEAQLRQAGGSLYDPSDLEGIIRNTTYSEPGKATSLDQALQNQYNIYGQRRSSGGGGGGESSSSSASASTGAMPDWYKGWFDDMRARQAADEAQRKQRADSLYSTWLGRSQQALTIDKNDPIIQQQADAYSANEERARRNYINDLAESAGPLANIRGEQRMSAERLGQRTGTFEAELVGRELATRRQEIADALNSMAGLLSQDQQVALQRELAILDQAIRERGLDLQGRSLDLDWERALLQNNQFNNDLALRAENQYNYWNDPLRTRV